MSACYGDHPFLHIRASVNTEVHTTSFSEYSNQGFVLTQTCLGQSIFFISPSSTTSLVSLMSFRSSHLGYPTKMPNITWKKLIKSYQHPLCTNDPFPLISHYILLICLACAIHCGGYQPRVILSTWNVASLHGGML